LQRIKLVIEYDGSNYSGWQSQDNANSVQSEIEKAIFLFCGEEVRIHGAGRTDRGVHALGQVVHFDCSQKVKQEKILNALNYYLRDKKIFIKSCSQVDYNFHARFSAKSRSYIYRINNKEFSVFENGRSLFVYQKLNIEYMQQAASLLVGEKDFSSFRAAGCQAKSAIVNITESIIQADDNGIITYRVRANAFLYHMIRNIVGTLLLVGKEQISVQQFSNILASKERKNAGPTAKAQGLYFLEVQY
jgi:tRNA pseudouridine38-40 synthase